MADHEEKPTAAQAYMHKMNETLNEICDLVGMSQAWTDPDTIRRRVKDIRTERDTAQARVSELEKTLEASRSAAQTYASAEIKANNRAVKAEARVRELEVEVVRLKSACPPVLRLDPTASAFVAGELRKLSSAGIVVEPATDPARDYDAEIRAARIDALKTLGVNPYDPPVCVIGAAKKRAKTLELAQKFEDELAQIWELWGAGRPMTPGCVYEAAQEMERTATALRVKLGAIAEKLNDARIPTHYGRDQKGGPVPLPERVGLLIDSHESARMLAETWESSSMREAAERMDAAAVLSDLGAPSHAGAIHLTTAAQILALPGLLRQE